MQGSAFRREEREEIEIEETQRQTDMSEKQVE